MAECCMHDHEHEHEKSSIPEYILTVIGIIVFVIAIFIKNQQ